MAEVGLASSSLKLLVGGAERLLAGGGDVSFSLLPTGGGETTLNKLSDVENPRFCGEILGDGGGHGI